MFLSCVNLIKFSPLLIFLNMLQLIYIMLAGNCDNCTSTRRERDMSKEAYLLLACIHSCKGKWGLNLPIDVLRGSRVS